MLRETKNKVFIGLVVVVVLALAITLYLNVLYVPKCQNYECWQKYMLRCSKASFINEEPEASWEYTVTGKSENLCAIKVKLLLAKKGELGINELVGHEMECSYPLGSDAYAEKDLSKCHGILKEELQTLIIKKLHTYLLENLGKVEEGLKEAL